MDSGGDKAAAKARHEFERQQLYQQQQLLLQQFQMPQQHSMPRYALNIDANLRPQHHLLHHRPLNPNSSSVAPSRMVSNPPPPPPSQPKPNQHQNPNLNPPALPINNMILQQHKASVQLAYEDAKRICHPDFKRPFRSLEDACERLLPYHVVADYEAEEDDKMFDTASSSDQTLSRSQQWDHSIATKVAEFTTIFEKQVTAYNAIQKKRRSGEFQTEEKLMLEKLLLQDEKQALIETRAAVEERQNAQEAANMQMAAMRQAESQAHNEMMVRAGASASNLGYSGGRRIGPNMGEQEQFLQQQGSINVWGRTNTVKDDDREELTEDFLNDDGDAGLQHGWPGSGQLDLNAR